MQGLQQWSGETQRIVSLMPTKGIFLTGIEGSDPHIDGIRRNQLTEAHDFYTNYETRLRAIKAMGITWLRFGMPYSQVHIAKGEYDFSFMDKVVSLCRELDIEVLADLLHFGLPDWQHEDNADEPFFQNQFFTTEFARFAREFALRYPHIRYYTIVNEPFVTAYLSAKLGLWNEHHASPWNDDRSFVKATANIARAAILGRKAIESVWHEQSREKDLIFLQNESFEEAIAQAGSGREAEADRFNLRRFAPLDLILGYRDEKMRQYLLAQGMSEANYEWFMDNGRMDKTILGIDHYPACIHTFYRDRTIDHAPTDPYQLYELTKTYWNRYPVPLLHTEVNGWPEHAVSLCQDTYNALKQLRTEGYPVLGMGWYGDDLQIGWHVAMRGPHGFEETPVGLHYKGRVQPVGELFARLSAEGFPPIGESQTSLEPFVLPQPEVQVN